jgi:hypothetical protein
VLNSSRALFGDHPRLNRMCDDLTHGGDNSDDGETVTYSLRKPDNGGGLYEVDISCTGKGLMWAGTIPPRGKGENLTEGDLREIARGLSGSKSSETDYIIYPHQHRSVIEVVPGGASLTVEEEEW